MLRLALQPSARGALSLLSRSFGSSFRGLAAAEVSASTPSPFAPKDLAFPEDVVIGGSVRYVRGLFEIAKKNGHIQAVREELNAALELSKNDVSFRDALKRGSIDDRFSDYLSVLINELKARQKTKLFSQVVEGFEEVCRSIFNEVHFSVTVPAELSKEQTQRLANDFVKNYVKKPCRVVMTVVVDPSILGGRIYRIQDLVIDLSEKALVDKWATEWVAEQLKAMESSQKGGLPTVVLPSTQGIEEAAADYIGHIIKIPAKTH